MNTTSNKDQTAVIDREYHWRPISTAPLGKKVQLINKDAGVAVYGQVGTNESFFTHWAPLPTFDKGESAPLISRPKPTPPPIHYGSATVDVSAYLAEEYYPKTCAITELAKIETQKLLDRMKAMEAVE